MADQLIALDSSPNQQFSIALAVDGATVRLQLAITFSELAGYWVMRVANADGLVLLDSLPLVTGTWPAANILAQYAHLGIGSAYVVSVGSASDDYPGAIDLGTDWLLIWADTVQPESPSMTAVASGVTFDTLATVGHGGMIL